MSRNITSGSTGVSPMLPEEYRTIKKAKNGKLLFTENAGKNLALLFQNDRLIAAQVLPDAKVQIGAVFIGKVKNVVKNIDACFVEIANRELCFLPMKEAGTPCLFNRNFDGRILEGDELLVQVTREAQKTKQASVTAQVSLSNEYVAISLGSPKVGYSNKLSKEERGRIEQLLIKEKLLEGKNFRQFLGLPSVGLVIRTQAGTCTEEKLLEKCRVLVEEFECLLREAAHRTCYSCMKEAANSFEVVLDNLVYSYEYDEIITENRELYEKLIVFCREHMPDKQLRLYEDTAYPLNKLYSVKSHIEEALGKRVWLKSGGYLIIEPTEALTVIDVNTGKYEGKKGNAETFLQINKEAAEEIALQLRLRNLSGMIVVDFINMNSAENENSLLELLRQLVKRDKQKTIVVDITPLGLVEITRKKVNAPLWEQLSSQ